MHDDCDGTFNFLCPQCDGICRPCEFGSTSAPTADSDRAGLTKAVAVLATVALVPLACLVILGGSDDKRAAAALGFAGVVVTACVSLAGTLLNRQTERRLEREHQDEFARLRLEAALEAGRLAAASA